MSDYVHITSANELKTHEPKPVAPTIMIGLGGTGIQVLLQLRRMIVERYGDLNDFPIISFLMIDLDSESTIQQVDIARERDFLMKKIDFKPSEKMLLRTNVSDITNDLDQNPHIKEWLPVTGDLMKKKDLTAGAGQIRPASRLAFFHYYRDIRARLMQAKNEISDVANQEKMRAHDIRIDTNNFNVYTIFSIAGGTGSGMCLDMSFLIKDLFPDATSVGYAVMPGIFKIHGERVLANAYSTLKEIDYYSLQNSFQVQWDLSEKKKEKIPPPFKYLYLIDSTNELGTTIGEKSSASLYNMIAKNIFQDFSATEFAGFKRGVKDNLDQYLNDYYAFKHKNADGQEVLQETFTHHYSSFGLAEISYPADRIINSCACKLASEIINQWSTDITQGSELSIVEYLVKPGGLLDQVHLREGEVREQGLPVFRHYVLQSLTQYDRDKSIRSAINVWASQLREQVLSGSPAVMGQSNVQYIRNKLDEYDKNFANLGNDPESWGDFARIMEVNRKNYTEELKKKLAQKIYGLIEDPAYGFSFAVNLLIELRRIINDETKQYKPYFERMIPEIEANMHTIGIENDRVLNRLSKLDRKVGLTVNVTRNHYLTNNLEPGYNDYFWKKTLLHAYQGGIKVFDDLIAYIGTEGTKDKPATGLLAQVKILAEKLDKMRIHFERKSEFFKEKQYSPLVYNVYESSDIETIFYPHYMGTATKRNEKLKKLGADLLKKLNAERVIDLINRFQADSAAIIEQEIELNTREFFLDIPRDFHILDLFQKRAGGDMADRLREMLQNCQTWVKTDDRGKFRLDLNHRKFMIGLPQRADDHLVGEFKDKVKNANKPGNPAPNYYNSSDQSQICFYTEKVGYPIFSIHNIEELKQKYSVQIEEEVDVHAIRDFYRFADLIPLNKEERDRKINAHRTLFLGIILGVIKTGEHRLKNDIKQQVYSFDQKIPGGHKVTNQFGVWETAIRELSKPIKENLCNEINVKVQEEKDKLRANGLLPLYSALLSYYLEEVYPLKYKERDGYGAAQVSSVEREIIIDELDKLDRIFAEEDVQFKKDKLLEIPDSYSDLLSDGKMRALRINSLKKSILTSAGADGKDDGGEEKECPMCRELILREAKFCKFCKTRLDDATIKPVDKPRSNRKKNCPSCNREIFEEAVKCRYCGSLLDQFRKCPMCAETIPMGLEVCPICGSSLTDMKQ